MWKGVIYFFLLYTYFVFLCWNTSQKSLIKEKNSQKHTFIIFMICFYRWSWLISNCLNDNSLKNHLQYKCIRLYLYLLIKGMRDLEVWRNRHCMFGAHRVWIRASSASGRLLITFLDSSNLEEFIIISLSLFMGVLYTVLLKETVHGHTVPGVLFSCNIS